MIDFENLNPFDIKVESEDCRLWIKCPDCHEMLYLDIKENPVHCDCGKIFSLYLTIHEIKSDESLIL